MVRETIAIFNKNSSNVKKIYSFLNSKLVIDTLESLI